MKSTDKGYGLVSIDKSNQNLFTDRDLNNNVYKKVSVDSNKNGNIVNRNYRNSLTITE